MDVKELLIDFHKRTHQSLAKLLKRCEQFSEAEINREFEGFGIPSIRESLHHMLTAERYWIGVPQDRIDAEDDLNAFPTIASLEELRQKVSQAAEEFLQSSTNEELTTSRLMNTWGNKTKTLSPANILFRTQTHTFQHQGQVAWEALQWG
jgi:uncharacterized damage-inducible protein DinB